MPMIIHHSVSRNFLKTPSSSNSKPPSANTANSIRFSTALPSSILPKNVKTTKARRKSALRHMGSSTEERPPRAELQRSFETSVGCPFRPASKSVSFHDIVASAGIVIRSISPKRLLAASSSTLGLAGLATAGNAVNGADLCRLMTSDCDESTISSGGADGMKASTSHDHLAHNAVVGESVGLRKSLSNYLIGCECY